MLLLLKPLAHRLVFQHFAPVGLGDTFTNGGAKAGGLTEQAQGGVLDEIFRIRPGMGGDPRELRFLLW